MTDWTLITTTLGSSTVTGTTAYLTARWSGRIALRRVEAENERLREQHREEHLRNRQGTYHEFLDGERELARMMLSQEKITPERYADHLARFHHFLNGVVLFGTQTTRETAEALTREYRQMWADHQDTRLRSFDSVVRTAYAERTDEIRAARQALIDAMRTDVAPEARSG